MAKQIARLLKTDVMADIDIPAIAQFLQSQGRRGDTILAHINAKEAEMLRKMGGAEERNPVTGLPEYFTIDGDYRYGADYGQRTADYSVNNSSSDYSPTNTFNIGENLSGLDDLRQPAIDQYSGSAFNYFPATPDIDSDVYRFQAAREFPSGMSARYSLPAGVQGAERTPYDISGTTTQPGLRMDGGGLGLDIGGRTLAPDITIPNRPSAATLSGAALDARMASDRDSTRPDPSMISRASAATGLSPQALARLGLAGLGTIQGIMASREASEQGRQARRETEALARPYQQRGEALIQQAQSGELTAAGQQQLQAVRARLAQGAEARGGVGAAQAAAQVEAFRQNLLQNQYDYGQKISNIGDQLMLGAIRTGLEADRYAAGLSNTYFTNMASIAVGMPPSMPTQQRGE
jgi:hypothetical protein